MARSVSPYDRRDKLMRPGAGVKAASQAGLLSMALHLAVLGVFLFLIPNLSGQYSRPYDERYIPFQHPGCGGSILMINDDNAVSGPNSVVRPGLEKPAPNLEPFQELTFIRPDDLPIENWIIETPLDQQEHNPTSEVGRRRSSPPQPSVFAVQEEQTASTGSQETTPPVTGHKSDSNQSETAPASAASEGLRLAPEMSRYYADIQSRVHRNWLWVAANLGNNEIETVLEVEIQPSGQITLARMLKSSGDKGFDHSILRAITASNPLPALPPIFENKAATVVFSFTPLDMFKFQAQYT